MKYLIASDIHGRLAAMETFYAAYLREQPDALILLGDLLYNGPRNGVPSDYDPMGVCKILLTMKDKTIAYIRGNCDSRVDEMVLGVSLSDVLHILINGQKATLFHGDEFSNRLIENSSDLLRLYGHTHLPELAFRDGHIYLNPGSIGFPKGGFPASYMVIEDNEISLRDLEGQTLNSGTFDSLVS